MSSIFKFFILIFLTSSYVLGAQEFCSQLLQAAQNDVEIKLSQPVSLELSELHGGKTKIITVYNKNELQIAYADYSFQGADIIKIGQIDISPAYWKNGLSKLILARIIEDNPQVKEIKTQLADRNEKVFNDFRDMGYSVLDAIKETPAYKVRAALGFSKIKEYEHKENHQRSYTGFTVVRD